jgi:YD repeat-containing protein
MKKSLLTFLVWCVSAVGLAAGSTAADSHRTVLSLNGTWEIAEGSLENIPETFPHTVPVPGLVSLATPAFVPMPGPPMSNRRDASQKDPVRDAFWYRRSFRLDQPVPAVAQLKVHKAMFGSRVVLNGQALGDHAPNQTPGYFDARAALRQGENVLLIRVGADREAVPPGVPNLRDSEKLRYIPGIFDSVELILSGTPSFFSLQCAPEIATGTVRVQAALRNTGLAAGPRVAFVVREAKSGRVVGQAELPAVACAANSDTVVDLRIPIADCRLWSPEDPFLYRLEADCGTDSFNTRFGMREFKLDPKTGFALLNGRPYPMRGSNITLYRFFEDPDCADLPWSDAWVRLLHQRVKDMKWNCLRYSIGFPPEAWYDIADELGILLQDEFSFWMFKTWSGKLTGYTEALKTEYADWMRERWNHPSVVIWDAQNESVTPETGEALRAVRGLDLSNRPWDNGWATPMAPTDAYETHPYHFYNSAAILADFGRKKTLPQGGPTSNTGTHATIINEYGWLWLNRDGSPTTLTRDLYRNLLGENSTTEQRRHLYATYLAADTEFWRSHRSAAALMEFCALGYSRADGQTSDHWTDVKTLAWEPEFNRYVRDAFAPVGLMVDYWRGTGISGRQARIPIRLVNDLDRPWAGPVILRLRSATGKGTSFEQAQEARVEAVGQGKLEFELTWPEPGAYVLEAELRGAEGLPVRSVRDLTLVDLQGLGVAFGKETAASSSKSPQLGPENAVDGDPSSFWVSAPGESSWLSVDLGVDRKIRRVRVVFGLEYPLDFIVQASTEGVTWTDVYAAADNQTTVRELHFRATSARFVRLLSTKRRPAKPGEVQGGISLRELQVFE